MKSLYAFGSGGSSFPGSPVAGVYYATDATIDAVAASVLSTPLSVVFNGDKNTIWYSNGATMFLLQTMPQTFADLPLSTTSGGVNYVVPLLATGSDESTGLVSYFDGTEWISTGQP